MDWYLNLMSLPPPQDDDPIITESEPDYAQCPLNDENIKNIDPDSGKPILHNYSNKHFFIGNND
jgi:hypothetical protein